MIAVHIGMLAVVLFLWIGGKAGWIPYKKYVEPREYGKILLVLLLGNLLGMCITWQNNQGRILQDGAYLVRPLYGQGNKTQQFLASVEDEEVVISMSIPQQQGEEEEQEKKEKKLTPQEALSEAIRKETLALNEEKQDPEKYYLPSNVNGKHIQWAYPTDHSGMILMSLAVFAGILLILMRERKRERELAKRKEQMLRDYPNLVTKLSLLVQAGMTMRRAFGKTALDYRQNKGKEEEPRYAYEEMLVTYYEMESGVLESQAYENFGRRCDQVQYRTLATLLSQNLKKGSQGLLDMLERESVTAFEDRKRQARILGEAAAMKLLIPMVLMLLVVLVIIMVPACMSFYG